MMGYKPQERLPYGYDRRGLDDAVQHGHPPVIFSQPLLPQIMVISGVATHPAHYSSYMVTRLFRSGLRLLWPYMFSRGYS